MARRRGRRNQLTLVCWLYPGKRNYRPKYVNVLYRQVQKFMPLRHRFVCIYDETAYRADDFAAGIELMPLPEVTRSLLPLGSLSGNMHPSCFARLWHFSQEAAEVLPGRVFMFDIDSIPIGDMSPLVQYRSDADFVSLRRVPSSSHAHIAGGSWILRAGAFPEVWDDFIADPIAAREAAANWYWEESQQKGWSGGSDQSWLSYRFIPLLSEDGPTTYWPDDCGILLWDHFRKQRGQARGCLLHFNGPKKPWNLDWPLTRELYGDMEYRVVGRPLKYGGRRYDVGAPFVASRPSHARALLATGRLEVTG